MADHSQDEIITLVSTLANFDPVFLSGIEKQLASWIQKNARSVVSLDWMRVFCDKGNSDQLGKLLELLPAEKITLFAIKLDKHQPQLTEYDKHEVIAHIVGLASGDIEPSPKPKKVAEQRSKAGTRKPKRPKLPVCDIIKFDDVSKRQTELESLTDKELKLQLEEIGMDVPVTLTKAKRIEFIQNELAAGWPKPRSILDSSRY